MRAFSELIEIDRRFEKAVNLQLDINSIERVNAYIPTISSLGVLKEYLNDLLEENGDNSTVLIGPYGKGKSHLLLVLLSILSIKKWDYSELITKAKKIDNETGVMIEKIVHQKKKYLPIIVSTSGDDLPQAFLQSLVDALHRNQLDDLTPDTYYQQAIAMIKQWKENYPETYEKLEDKLRNEDKNSVSALIRQLSEFNKSALNRFQLIYPLLTSGSLFNPLVQTETVNLYEQVCIELSKRGDYQGIYIVFDEFSKYIEGHAINTFSKDMKVLQDMCELANKSKRVNMHITFVAHKSVKEYGKTLPIEVKNAFLGVEGRLTERFFVISAKNNYELLSDTIKKKSSFEEEFEQNKLIQDVVTSSYKSLCFHSLFSKEEFTRIIGKGCFPITPISAYILVQVCEKVAQNERTLFTYISGNEQGSVWRVIHECVNGYLGADRIYDYFRYIFREDEEKVLIHNEWLKAEYALTNAQTEEERKIIKSLALIHMVNNMDELSATSENIRLAIGIDKENFQINLNQLMDRQLIVWRSKNGVYAFKNNVGVNLEEEIKKTCEKIYEKTNVIEEIKTISEINYILPKAHNYEYSMTRYFSYEFMESNEFLNLNNADYLFDETINGNKFSDGKIIALFSEYEVEEKEIISHLSMLNDARLVLILPNDSFKQKEKVVRNKAIRQLRQDTDFVENNIVLEQELMLCEEDLIYEINQILENMYLPEKKECRVFHMGEKCGAFHNAAVFNRFLSNICNDYYSFAPKVNNELLNIRNVGSQYKRARNIVTDMILSQKDLSSFESGTSPESIIYRATMIHTGINDNRVEIDLGCQRIGNEIKKFFFSAAGRKKSFQDLFVTLQGREYGVRRGILPIYIAYEFIILQDTPIIYLKNQEVEPSGELLSNLSDTPENYYLYVEEESSEKEKYIFGLEKLFGADDKASSQTGLKGIEKQKRLIAITSQMQKWYRSLPQCTINYQSENQVVNAFRNCIKKPDTNPRELLYVKIPSVLGNEFTYSSYIEAITKIKLELDKRIDFLYEKAISITKECFKKRETDGLATILKEWYQDQNTVVKKYLLSTQISNLMSYLENLKTFDEREIVWKMSKIVVDLYIEDWSDIQMVDYRTKLTEILRETNEVDSDNDLNSKNKIVFTAQNGVAIEKYYDVGEDDSTSYFLRNAIEQAMDDFGNTLDTNQKLAILVQTIEDLFK